MSLPNISIKNSLIPLVTMPVETFNMMVEGSYSLKIRSEKAEKEEKTGKQHIKTLEDEITALKNSNAKFESLNSKEELLIQLIDEDLKSSKRVLQRVCTVSGAVLGGGLVLVFPPVIGISIALGGTGSAAGVALVGGVTGRCLVAPIIHKKTHKALIQQVQNFKAKEDVANVIDET